MQRDERSGSPGALLRFARPYAGYLAAALACTALSGLAGAAVYWVVKEVIDKVLTGGGPDRLRMLNLVIVEILALYLTRGVFYFGQVYLASLAGNRSIVDLRNSLFDHLQKLSVGFHDRVRTADTLSRVTGDVTLLQNVITTGFADVVLSMVTLLAMVGLLIYLDAGLALLTFMVMPAVAYVTSRAGRRQRSVGGLIQSKIADVTAVLQEALSSIRVVKAFTLEPVQMNKFAHETREGFLVSMKSARITALSTPLVEVLAACGLCAVLWYGGNQVITGRMTPGEFFAFLGAAGSVAAPLSRLAAVYASFQQALAAGDRIAGLLAASADLTDAPDAIDLPPLRGRVSLEGAWFAYPGGEPVLKDLNVEIQPGETVALVGPSGAGKSTLASLLLRFYDPTRGVVSVDGHDLRRVRMSSLRSQIGFVPQDTILFGVSVAENIGYGRPGATMEEIVEAAKMANADGFIRELPDGYGTLLGEKGASLSGGERQRMAIARAMLRDPRILVLDEATSSLDSESERLVQEAIDRLHRGRTTIIIAHRLSTVRNADRILVLDRGRVVEAGTHSELLARGGLYSRLCAAQFGRRSQAPASAATAAREARSAAAPAGATSA